MPRRTFRPYPRLTTPLTRNPRTGILEPASWNDALDAAAEGFRKAKQTHGSDSIGTFSCSKSTNEVNYLAQKLSRVAFGTNNIDSCNRT